MSDLEIYEQPSNTRGLSLGEKLQLADTYSRAELVPKAFKGKAADIVIAIEYGEMVNVHPLAAMNLIHVIEGKPTMSAELMRSQVARAGHKFRVLTHSSTEATVQIVRGDDPDYPVTVTWTLEDAERAGLRDVWWERWVKTDTGKNFKDVWIAPDGFPLPATAEHLKHADAPEWVLKQGPSQAKRKDNWWNYPQSMLLARATSDAVRAVCPEVLMGVSYTPEELGASVDADGNVLDVAEVPRTPPPAELQALIDRFEKLPQFLQEGMMGKLSTDAHCDASVPLADYPEPWWAPIGQLLDYAERKAAEHAAEPPAQETAAAGAGDREVPEGVASTSGTPAAPVAPAEPVEVLDVHEAPSTGSVVPPHPFDNPDLGGDSAPRDPAPGGAEPPSSGGDGASAGPTPPRPPATAKKPITATTRSMLFALLPKGIPCPPEIGTAQSARDEYRRVMLLEGICPALGAGVLASRKDIDEDLGQKIIAVLQDMEAGRVELTDGPDGELAIVATAGAA